MKKIAVLCTTLFLFTLSGCAKPEPVVSSQTSEAPRAAEAMTKSVTTVAPELSSAAETVTVSADTNSDAASASGTSKSREPEYTPEELHSLLRIYVAPTALGGDRVYYIPEPPVQEALLALLNTQKESEPITAEFWKNRRLEEYGFGISYQGTDYEIFNENMIIIRNSNSPVAFEHEALCREITSFVEKEAGITPFSTDMIQNIAQASLVYRDSLSREIAYAERIYSADKRKTLEQMLDGSEVSGGSGCPFMEFTLNLSTADDRQLELAMASDSCNIYFVNGRYIAYQSGSDNTPFYELFPHIPAQGPKFRPEGSSGEEKDSLAEGSSGEAENSQANSISDQEATLRAEARSGQNDAPQARVQFSQTDIAQAMNCTEEQFKNFAGCELLHLWYDKERSEQATLQYLTYGRGRVNKASAENTMVLFSDFAAPPETCKDPTLMSQEPHTNFSWTLIRDDRNAP